MKEYKMIVLDMDGTLLNDKQQISEKTKQALIKAQQDGMILVLASGRNYHKLINYANELLMSDYHGYLVEGNGMNLRSLSDQSLYREKKMTSKQAQMIMEVLLQYEEEIITIYDDGMFCYLPANILAYKKQLIKANHLDPNVLTCGPYHDFVDHRKAYPNLKYIQKVNEIDCDVNKVCMKVNEIKLKQILPELKLQLNDYWCGAVSSMWIEITLPHISKYQMVKRLCKQLNIDLSQVIAFGDGENDMELLSQVGKSVAMANALDSVKAICDVITLDHNHDGIAWALNLHLKS